MEHVNQALILIRSFIPLYILPKCTNSLFIITTAMPELGLTQTQGRFTVASRLSFFGLPATLFVLTPFRSKIEPL